MAVSARAIEDGGHLRGHLGPRLNRLRFINRRVSLWWSFELGRNKKQQQKKYQSSQQFRNYSHSVCGAAKTTKNAGLSISITFAPYHLLFLVAPSETISLRAGPCLLRFFRCGFDQLSDALPDYDISLFENALEDRFGKSSIPPNCLHCRLTHFRRRVAEQTDLLLN